jgi:Uma2 family endonuclease
MNTIELVESKTLTLDEYARLYAAEGAFEIINGERKLLMPHVVLHGWMIRVLFRLLDSFCLAHKLGEVFSELPVVQTDSAQWVAGALVPDLMFYERERWQAYTAATPDWKSKPILLPPDLAVEVVSKNDLYSEIQRKVEKYLEIGVRLVWIVDPQPDRQRITVYEGGRFSTLHLGDVLSGGEVIPGFEIALATLFEN